MKSNFSVKRTAGKRMAYFLLAAILNLVTGKYRYKRSVRNQKKKISSALQMAFGGALAVLAVISAVSIWWR